MSKNDFYFSIDNAVICNNRLTMTARVLYCYISNYWKQGLNVFASNKHFSEALGVSKATISRALVELKEARLIVARYSKTENNIETRVIIKPKKMDDSELMQMFKRVIELKKEHSKEV